MNKIEQLKISFLSMTDGNYLKAALNVRGGMKVYGSSYDSGERSAFRRYWHEQVTFLGKQYEKKVSEEKHCRNIENLSDVMTEKYGRILLGNRFRIGIAQKSLNLFLKYEWCRGEIPTPPHCTVDGIILRGAGIYGIWTACDSIEEYKGWIEGLKAIAKLEGRGEELAEWELRKWGGY